MARISCIICVCWLRSGPVLSICFQTRLAQVVSAVLAHPQLRFHTRLKHWLLRVTLLCFLSTWTHPWLHVVTSSMEWMLVNFCVNLLVSNTLSLDFAIQLASFDRICNCAVLSGVFVRCDHVRGLTNFSFWFDRIFVIESDCCCGGACAHFWKLNFNLALKIVAVRQRRSMAPLTLKFCFFLHSYTLSLRWCCLRLPSCFKGSRRDLLQEPSPLTKFMNYFAKTTCLSSHLALASSIIDFPWLGHHPRPVGIILEYFLFSKLRLEFYYRLKLLVRISLQRLLLRTGWKVLQSHCLR